jgi:hypothetical protein
MVVLKHLRGDTPEQRLPADQLPGRIRATG